MPKKFNARRYARAVLEIALAKDELEKWRADLDNIVAAVSEGPFLNVLSSPKVKFEEKARLLEARLAGISPLALNLVMLLVARGGVNMLDEIANEYRHMVDEHFGIQTAAVVTAIPLDKKEEERLAKDLGRMTGKKVRLESSVDPSIIGGIVARVGGKLLDGSTLSKLTALKKDLTSGGRVG
ncbi:MAG: ATP synthase F1 subunit delta [Chloroflexi bacterium RBG_13_57_8]|nr:MAG: ATP synthase F1 subunit delta [Chloroflexi bacterium RBG_13_57_8]